jgi:serine/threonine-protein kinase
MPEGWRELRELSSGTQGRVLLVERGGERAVCRLVPSAGTQREDLAELEVLARVQHPGLARLLAHGELTGAGTRYTLRSWVEGQELGAQASQLRARGAEGEREIGRLVARLCPALEELHRAGFVHGDLKPANVIVRADGEPVLTDFGLSRALQGERRTAAVSGTLFALAPEVLLGLRADARSDLFALGVLLHGLLLAQRAGAREFYARFPEHDFFDATRTRVSQLPEWARDVTARLVERDPGGRPGSALELARLLAARLDLDLPAGAEPRLGWPVRRGREAFFAHWVEGLRSAFAQAAEAPGSSGPLACLPPRWVELAPGEDPGAVVEELRLGLALEGSPSQRIDLERSGRELGDGLALDQWLRAQARASRAALLFVACAQPSSWELHRIEGLARALAREEAAHDGDPALLVVVAAQAPPSSEITWRVERLPPVEAAALAQHLERELADPPARIEELANALHAHSAGAAARLDALLHALEQSGAFLRAERGRRLRPGPLQLERLASPRGTERDPARRSAGARELRAALHVCG